MTINGIAVGSGTTTTTGTGTGTLSVTNPVNGLTGTITVVITHTTSSGGSFRIDDFTLNGSVNTCSGCTAPTTQVSALTFTTLNPLNYTIGWTNGSGTGRLLIGKATSPIADPVQNADHSAIDNSTWTAGTNEMPPVGSTIRVLYDGIGNSVNVSALTAETQYCFNVYEWQGTHCYNLTELTGCRYTLSVEPTSHASSFTCTTNSSTQITTNFTAASAIANADGYIILQKIGSAPTGLPADGTNYSVGNTVGDATVAAIVNSTSATSQSLTGLTPNTNYYFTLVPFNHNGTPSNLTYNFYTAATIPSTNCTTNCPTIAIGTQPVNRVITAGTSTTFTIGSITPVLSYTYQWQVNTGSGWSDLTNVSPYTNVTTTTLNISTATTLLMSGYQYRCNVTYTGCTPVASNAALLTVNNTSPTLGLSGFNASCPGFTQGNTTADLTWGNAGGTVTGYAVFVLQSASGPTGVLNDANTYIANSNYSAGSLATPNTLGKCVYNGSGNTVSVTGLTNNVSYSFRVIAYNGNTQTGWYTGNAASTNVTNRIIDLPEVSSLAASSANTSSAVTWVNPSGVLTASKCWDQILVVANQGTVSFTPTGDGTAYTANTVYSGANQVVFKATPATSPNVTVTGLTNGTQYCFKVFVRKGTEWSNGVEICTVPMIPVCASSGDLTFDDRITNVTFNSINNNSDLSSKAAGYTFYNNISTTVNTGTNYTLSTTVNTDGAYTNYQTAWFDWNNDGDFLDANETYILGDVDNTTAGVNSLSILVPYSAAIGAIRMRVSTRYFQTPLPCDVSFDGEVEDYIIKINACTTTATISSFTPTSGSENTIVRINGTNLSGTTNVLFNGVPAKSFTIVNSTLITAEVPSDFVTGKITIVTGTCGVQSAGNFTYLYQSGTCSSTSTELFISEIHDPTSGNNHYIEIANYTGATVTFSGLYVLEVVNLPGGTTTTYTPTGSIANNTVMVFWAGADGTLDGGQGGPTGFNELDEIRLKKSGSIIDRVIAPNETGYTFIRKPTITSPNATYTASEWTFSSTPSTSNIGIHTFNNNPPFTITAEPVDVSSCGITMSVTVTGAAVTYQWKYNDGFATGWTNVTTFPNTTIAGATTNSLSITGDLLALNNYQFYCEVTGGACVRHSDAAQFTLVTKPVFRTTGTGNWTSVSIWEMATSLAGPWESACTYPRYTNSTNVYIRNGHTVTYDRTDDTLDYVKIETGGSLQLNATTKMSILDAQANEDFIVEGTLIDRTSSGNSLTFIDPAGPSNNATWIMGASGTVIRTNTGQVDQYRDYYIGGMSNIPSTSNWYYRYDGASNPSTGAAGFYYGNLYFDNTANTGLFDFNSNLMSMTGNVLGKTTVKGDLNIGTTGTGTVKVYYNNVNTNPMLVYGNVNIATNNTFTNQTCGVCTVSSSCNAGTGIEVRGNITNNGAIDLFSSILPAATTNKGILKFSAGNTQIVSGSGTFDLYDVELAKTAQTLVDQQVNLTANNNLNFTGGILKTNANVFTVANPSVSAAVTGYETPNTTGSYSNDKYVNGKLERAINSAANYIFPVGSTVASLGYNPVRLNTTSATSGNATAQFNDGDPGSCYTAGRQNFTCAGSPKFLEYTDMTGLGWWNFVSSTGTTFDYTIYLHPNTLNTNVNPNENTPIGHTATYRALKKPTGVPYDYTPYIFDGDECIISNTYYQIIGAGYSGFSDFAPGGGIGNTTPLPVELSRFIGNCNGNNVQLDWTTLSEKNSKLFIIERSTDGIHFENIGNVNAAGFSNTIKNYSFIDSASSTENYYRLVELDIDNAQQTSTIIKVSCDGVNGTNIFYTPTNGVEVEIYATTSKELMFNVYEVSGRLLHQETKQIQQGYSKFSLDIKRKLANGIYLIQQIDGTKSTSTKVWVH